MERICSWLTPPDEIPYDQWAQLHSLYDSPVDIDLFPAGLAERPHQDGIVGKTFNCLMAKQFKNIKFGDRFFFTFPQNPMPFDYTLMNVIQNRRLADVICDTTDIEFLRRNVFLTESTLDYKCGKHVKLGRRQLTIVQQYGGYGL